MDLRPLQDLEERVRKTAEVIRSLRRENDDLKNALDRADSKSGSKRRSKGDSKDMQVLKKDHANLEKRITLLTKEKEQLRVRVRGLIKEIDALDLED